MYYYILFGVLAGLGMWLVGSYAVIRNIEEPSYVVVEKRDGYEIRQYSAYIVAETAVSGDYRTALSDGFRIIADYIFGNNTTKTSISMTTPVIERTSETIAMTVPVVSSAEPSPNRTVAFVLPSKYTLETLPQPNNSAVELRAVSSRKVAVRRFTWYVTEKRIEAQKAVLLEQLKRDGVDVLGTAEVAQYNPPLSFPLTLRNEIIVPIN